MAGGGADPGRVPDAAYDDGALRIIPVTDGPPGVILAGEIDEQNRAALAAAVDKLASGHQEFHVDMAAVTYCDLAGLRVILRLGGEDGSGPGQVVLAGLPGYLEKIIRIVGWDRRPDVSIHPPAHQGGCPAGCPAREPPRPA